MPLTIAEINASIAACNAKIQELNEKLERLEPVKPVVQDAKDDVMEQDIYLNAVKDMLDWSGKNLDDYREQIEAGLLTEYTSYISSMDELVEKIDQKIEDLKAAIKEQQNRITKLKMQKIFTR